MRFEQYYNWEARRPLGPNEGCAYEVWNEAYSDFLFAIHDKGFPVFLPPDQLHASDEYHAGDPYVKDEAMDTEFQKRRIDGTIHLLEVAFGCVDKRERLLDIGCGEAHLTARIQKAFPKAEISALDYSISAIERASSCRQGIEYCVADACRAPYRPEYFDAVICNNLWEHVENPLSLLGRIRQITKPDGYLILSTPSHYRIANLIRVVFGKNVKFMTSQHVTEYSVGQAIEMLRFKGFNTIEIYKKPIKDDAANVLEFIGYKIVKPLLSFYGKVIRSHHSFEKTVFILAQKHQRHNGANSRKTSG